MVRSAKLETKKQQLAKVTLQLAKMYVKKTGKTLDEITGLMKASPEVTTFGSFDALYLGL